MKDVIARKAARQRSAEMQGSRDSVRDPVGHSSTRVPAAPPTAAPPASGRYPHIVGLRLSHNLYATAENVLESSHRAGDYSLTSMPDLIRAALSAYFNGMELDAPPERGGKRRTTIGLDEALKSRYDQLPPRKRGEIVGRALRTFLNGWAVTSDSRLR